MNKVVKEEIKEKVRIEGGKIPKNIKGRKDIGELHLIRMNLRIPQWITEIEGLEVLNLSFNKISSIPKEIKLFESLKILNIEGNNLKTIPSHLWKTKNLQEIDITYNEITKISIEGIREAKLKKIRLSHDTMIENLEIMALIAKVRPDIKILPKVY